MSKLSIPHIRLANHRLVGTTFKTPKEVVAWLGAVQAQEYNMAKWAVGTRLVGCTDKQVEDALGKGDILRTHILRPTWHFVAKEDIRWMLKLTAPRIRQALATYRKTLGIDDRAIAKAIPVMLKVLEGGNQLTRQEVAEAMEQKGAKFRDSDVVKYALFHAEVDALICSGAVKGKKQTYALLDEMAPSTTREPDNDESLEMLARRFFTSHAPATLQDFTWWSGLSLTEARKALEMIKSDFAGEEIDGEVYWFGNAFKGLDVDKDTAHLLPAFDEYVVSYKDRKDIFEHGNYAKVISTNGIFKPTVMVSGQMVGMWKRVVKSKKTVAEVELFTKLTSKAKSAIAEEVERFEAFNR